MFDCRGLQGLSIIMGIISIILAYASFYFSIAARDLSSMFIGYVFGMVIGVVGIVLGGATIREAKKMGLGKARSIVGLMISIGGLFTNFCLCLLYGGTAFLATQL